MLESYRITKPLEKKQQHLLPTMSLDDQFKASHGKIEEKKTK